MELEQDPFLIENWQQYAKDCLEQGKLWLFRKTLCDYIWLTNRPVKQELEALARQRQGEMMREQLDEQIKRRKTRVEKTNRKFI